MLIDRRLLFVAVKEFAEDYTRQSSDPQDKFFADLLQQFFTLARIEAPTLLKFDSVKASVNTVVIFLQVAGPCQ